MMLEGTVEIRAKFRAALLREIAVIQAQESRYIPGSAAAKREAEYRRGLIEGLRRAMTIQT